MLALFAQEGLGATSPPAGELHLALRAGFAPERIVLHGNAKSTRPSCAMALDAGVGLIVIDNFDEIERLERLTAGRAGDAASRC